MLGLYIILGLEAKEVISKIYILIHCTLLVADMFIEIWDMLCPLCDFLGDSVVGDVGFDP